MYITCNTHILKGKFVCLYINVCSPLPNQQIYETEEDNKLNIFDIQIIRTEEGKYETTVYSKKAASDRHVHFTSSQAWKEKACAIRTLKSRALDYCSTDALLADELSHLLQVFIGNGYLERTVGRIL